jgi:hypothetical protein
MSLDVQVDRVQVDRLEDELRERLARHFEESDRLLDSEFDEDVFKSLASLSRGMQMSVVEAFCRADLKRIRNAAAYFVGIIKKHRDQTWAMPLLSAPFQGHVPPPYPSRSYPSYEASGGPVPSPPSYGSRQYFASATSSPGSLPGSLTGALPGSLTGQANFPLSESLFPSLFAARAFFSRVSPNAFCMIAKCTIDTQLLLWQFLGTGFFKPSDLDPRTLEALSQLSEEKQYDIMRHLLSVKMQKIRNKKAYVRAMIRRADPTKLPMGPLDQQTH